MRTAKNVWLRMTTWQRVAAIVGVFMLIGAISQGYDHAMNERRCQAALTAIDNDPQHINGTTDANYYCGPIRTTVEIDRFGN